MRSYTVTVLKQVMSSNVFASTLAWSTIHLMRDSRSEIKYYYYILVTGLSAYDDDEKSARHPPRGLVGPQILATTPVANRKLFIVVCQRSMTQFAID